MAQGPSLLFDKSTLESLTVNEAVLLDNFHRSTITPMFFVESLADLERQDGADDPDCKGCRLAITSRHPSHIPRFSPKEIRWAQLFDLRTQTDHFIAGSHKANPNG